MTASSKIQQTAQEIHEIGCSVLINFFTKRKDVYHLSKIRTWKTSDQHIKNAFYEIAKWHLLEIDRVSKPSATTKCSCDGGKRIIHVVHTAKCTTCGAIWEE